MEIDIKKKYRTKAGHDVVIYQVRAEGVYPVHGAIGSQVQSWTADGSLVCGGYIDELDLVEVKEKRSGWINIYSMPQQGDFRGAGMYNTRELADDRASENRIACIRVTYTDGEGL